MANNPQLLQVRATRKLSSDDETSRYLAQVAQAQQDVVQICREQRGKKWDKDRVEALILKNLA